MRTAEGIIAGFEVPTASPQELQIGRDEKINGNLMVIQLYFAASGC